MHRTTMTELRQVARFSRNPQLMNYTSNTITTPMQAMHEQAARPCIVWAYCFWYVHICGKALCIQCLVSLHIHQGCSPGKQCLHK